MGNIEHLKQICLSPRLQAIVDFIPLKASVADIGTDHAYVPLALAQRGQKGRLLASDIRTGPLRYAAFHIAERGWQERIELRQGDGLAVLRPGEVEWAVIAGMGARTIIALLEAEAEVRNSLTGLVLQPMDRASPLRRWLAEQDMGLGNEVMVEEEGKFYEILQILPGSHFYLPPAVKERCRELPENIIIDLGPWLLARGDPVFQRYLQIQRAKKLRIWQKLATRGLTETTKLRQKELARELAVLEKVIECY